jgi:hypothetical protein
MHHHIITSSHHHIITSSQKCTCITVISALLSRGVIAELLLSISSYTTFRGVINQIITTFSWRHCRAAAFNINLLLLFVASSIKLLLLSRGVTAELLLSISSYYYFLVASSIKLLLHSCGVIAELLLSYQVVEFHGGAGTEVLLKLLLSISFQGGAGAGAGAFNIITQWCWCWCWWDFTVVLAHVSLSPSFNA